MEKTKLLLCICFLAAVVLVACSKGGNGYFGRPLNTPSTPPAATSGTANGQYIFFFNIFIDSNSTYTFKLSQLTQGVLDSGTFNITFKSNLVVENVWYP